MIGLCLIQDQPDDGAFRGLTTLLLRHVFWAHKVMAYDRRAVERLSHDLVHLTLSLPIGIIGITHGFHDDDRMLRRLTLNTQDEVGHTGWPWLSVASHVWTNIEQRLLDGYGNAAPGVQPALYADQLVQRFPLMVTIKKDQMGSRAAWMQIGFQDLRLAGFVGPRDQAHGKIRCPAA